MSRQIKMVNWWINKKYVLLYYEYMLLILFNTWNSELYLGSTTGWLTWIFYWSKGTRTGVWSILLSFFSCHNSLLLSLASGVIVTNWSNFTSVTPSIIISCIMSQWESACSTWWMVDLNRCYTLCVLWLLHLQFK